MAVDPLTEEFFGEKKTAPKGVDPVTAEFFGEELGTESEIATAALGSNFDPENFAQPGLRINLSRGDTMKEKNLRLQKIFPEGEVKNVQASILDPRFEDKDERVLVFRESPNDQFKLVEPEGLDFTDVAEAIAPSFESIIAEGLMAVATGGGSVPQTVLRQGIGALTGEAAEQTLQSMRGTQSQDLKGQLGEISVEGGLSVVGGFAVSPIVGITNALTGRGILQVGDEGIEAIKAARELGVDDLLTPGIVSDNPIVRISENQSRVILPMVQKRYNELAKSINTILRSGSTGGGRAKGTVLNALQAESDRAIRSLQVNARRASEGGDALQRGIAEYDLVQNRIVGDLYETARRIEDPQFNVQPLKDVAFDLRKGSKGKLDPKVDRLLKDLAQIKGPLDLSNGKTLTVTDQIRNVRTGAYALSQTAPGEVADQTVGQASDLFKAINTVLENPLNSNQQFVSAWRLANDAASERFNTLGKMAVIKVAKSENPAELVAAFARPGQVGNLLTLRNTIEPQRWGQFTDSFRVKLLDNPFQLKQTLESFDDETLNVLIPRAEQTAWKQVATQLDRIGKVGAEKIAETTTKNRAFVGDLISGANQRAIDTVKRSIIATGDPASIRSFQAGVMDWATGGLTESLGRKISFKKGLLEARIKTLKELELWQFLAQDQRSYLTNAHAIQRSIQTVNDAGTSIRGAEIGSGIARLEPAAIRGLIQSGVISHFTLSKAGRTILIGTGKASSKGEYIRALGGALAQVSNIEDLSEIAIDE